MIQLLTGGLALGAVYALVALGFVVIYRSSEVFNFAQGELLMLGAFLMTSFVEAGLPWPVALLACVVCTGLFAAAIERGVLRPLIGRPVFVTIILTIFIGLLMRTMMLMIWGTDIIPLQSPWDPMATVEIGDGLGVVELNELATVAAGAVALTAFFIVIRKTRFGVAMRATANDQETALGLGIPVGRVFAISWFIAGAFAALGGVFLCMQGMPQGVDLKVGFIALHAFPAVIIGGLDSALGAVIAGLLLGVLEVLAEVYVNPALGSFGQGFHMVFPYLLMILFLVVRPYGIFGKRRVERI